MNFNLLAAIEDGSQLLILLVILLIAAPLPAFVSWNLAFKFKKNKSEVKYMNKTLFTILVVLQSLAIITAILGMVFYFVPIGNENLSNILIILFIVFTFVLCASWYSLILFVPQYIWFIFEEDKMTTIGDSLRFSKIKKIIDDKDKGKIYINYSEGKKTLKKIKFSKKTVIGQYFMTNAEKTGVKIKTGNQVEYFKEELLKLKVVDPSMPNKKADISSKKNEINEVEKNLKDNSKKEESNSKEIKTEENKD